MKFGTGERSTPSAKFHVYRGRKLKWNTGHLTSDTVNFIPMTYLGLTEIVNRHENSPCPPTRYQKLTPEIFGTILHVAWETRSKPVPIFWYRILAPISGKFVMGITTAEFIPITSGVIHADSSGELSAARLSANTRKAYVPSWKRRSSWNLVGSSDRGSCATLPTLVQSPAACWSVASTTNPTTGQSSGRSAAAVHSSHRSPVIELRNTFSGSSGRPGIPITKDIQYTR